MAEVNEAPAPLTPSRQVHRRETRVRPPREQSSGSEPQEDIRGIEDVEGMEPIDRAEPVDVTRPAD